MSIRGKPPNLYTYAKGGGRIPLPGSRKGSEVGWKPDTARAEDDNPAYVALRKKAWRANRDEAVQNLLLLQRPLKPPTRRTP